MTGILLLRSLVIGVHSVASLLSSQRLLFTLVVIRTSFSPVQTQCWIIGYYVFYKIKRNLLAHYMYLTSVHLCFISFYDIKIYTHNIKI